MPTPISSWKPTGSPLHAHDANVRVWWTCGCPASARVTCPDRIYSVAGLDPATRAASTFLPTVAAFEAMMAKLGIGDSTRVVVYDERGGIHAARCGGSSTTTATGTWR